MSGTKNSTSVSYDYDEKAASHADDIANRIDDNGAFIGVFKRAQAVTAESGSTGIKFEFEAPGGGSASFSLYGHRGDGSVIFGWNLIQAAMCILGLKGLKSEAGKVSVYDKDSKKSVEADGEVFPQLCNKAIGIVMQKELYTKDSGGETSRVNLYSFFHPETRLTASEIREKKTKPEKFEKIMKKLKTKDSRKPGAAEVAQPSMGAPATGDY